MTPPFHRLLSFYSNLNPHDSQTIRLQDSLRGNLSLGLDLPVAFAIALGRHLFLRNTSLFSLNIHVPSVSWTSTPLHDLPINTAKSYTCSELVGLARREKGWFAAVDALGLWSLAAGVESGLVSGADVRAFQEGALFERVRERRRGVRDVLPVWRGGPVWVAGHRWVCGRGLGVEVYGWDLEGKGD